MLFQSRKNISFVVCSFGGSWVRIFPFYTRLELFITYFNCELFIIKLFLTVFQSFPPVGNIIPCFAGFVLIVTFEKVLTKKDSFRDIYLYIMSKLLNINFFFLLLFSLTLKFLGNVCSSGGLFYIYIYILLNMTGRKILLIFFIWFSNVLTFWEQSAKKRIYQRAIYKNT